MKDCCKNCGSEDLHRDSVDVGVGVIYGPYGCMDCGWCADDEFDLSNGKSPIKDNGWVVDQYGRAYPPGHHVNRAYRMAEGELDINTEYRFVEDDDISL